MFELFDHTADLGLRIRAPDLNTLFQEAAMALFTAIVDDLTAVQDRERVTLELEADDCPYLLFDWLNELLYRFEAERLLFGHFQVNVQGKRLRGVAGGEPFDAGRHSLSHEVKAITYHGLRVEKLGDGWLAELIVDI
jgi:SHS2 domain-containing protein